MLSVFFNFFASYRSRFVNSSRHSTARRWAAVVGSVLLVQHPLSAGALRAAAVKIEITPTESKMLGGYGPRASTGVHDPIHHRVLVVSDGATEWVLVSSEFCVMSPAQYDEVAARLEREQGVSQVNFWWSLTHTHSAPEIGPGGMAEVFLPERYEHNVDQVYTDFVADELLGAVKQARQELRPARLGVEWGHSRANMNRRARDIDGTTRLGMNPDGAVDRKIGLLRVDDLQGQPIALVANYPIHGTVLGGQSMEISGDAPGVVSTYVEEKLGVPMLFINGAAGNLAPIYSVYPSPQAGHLSEFRLLLGDKILAANDSLRTTINEVRLDISEVLVETPVKDGLAWSDSLSRYVGADAHGQQMVRMPIRLLKMGDDLAIWSAPIELFCEVSNEIREMSAYPHTFYYGYTNGWLGYLLTDEEAEFGGYELRVSPFAPGAADNLKKRVLAELNQ